MKLKKSGKKPNSAVQTGDMGGSKFSLKGMSRRQLFIFAGLVVLVLASAAWLIFTRENKQSPTDEVKLKTGQSVSGQVDLLSDEDAKKVASNTKTSNNVDAAYAKALALSKLEDNQAAINEFQAITKTGKATYYMYNDFALVAARSGNFNLAIQEMQTAIDTLKSNNSVDNDTKNALLNRYESKLNWFNQELAR